MSNTTLKLYLDKPQDLVFSISISGTSEPIKETRLTIDNNSTEKNKVSFLGESKDDKFVFHVPKLAPFLDPGKTQWALEIIIGDRLFVPLSGEAELVAPVEVVAALQTSSSPSIIVAEMAGGGKEEKGKQSSTTISISAKKESKKRTKSSLKESPGNKKSLFSSTKKENVLVGKSIGDKLTESLVDRALREDLEQQQDDYQQQNKPPTSKKIDSLQHSDSTRRDLLTRKQKPNNSKKSYPSESFVNQTHKKAEEKTQLVKEAQSIHSICNNLFDTYYKEYQSKLKDKSLDESQAEFWSRTTAASKVVVFLEQALTKATKKDNQQAIKGEISKWKRISNEIYLPYSDTFQNLSAAKKKDIIGELEREN